MTDSDLESLPSGFLQRLSEILPADWPIAGGFQEKNTSFRVNVLVASPDAVLDELSQDGISFSPIDWCANAYHVPKQERDALVRTAAFEQGRIYVQNVSSLLPAVVLDPQPEQVVLDLAAAPGGKTLHLACMMNNRGTLSAVEPIKSRFFRLKRNLQLHQATFVKTYMTDGRSVGHKTGARFDKVLLDAPCSSEARIRIDKPESWAFWSDRKISEQSRKQFGLLKSAMRATKPGGVILYCTCSFAPEENELVVQKLLKRFESEVCLEPIELPIQNQMHGLVQWKGKELNASLRHCRRVLADESFDGFFLAKIRKA